MVIVKCQAAFRASRFVSERILYFETHLSSFSSRHRPCLLSDGLLCWITTTASLPSFASSPPRPATLSAVGAKKQRPPDHARHFKPHNERDVPWQQRGYRRWTWHNDDGLIRLVWSRMLLGRFGGRAMGDVVVWPSCPSRATRRASPTVGFVFRSYYSFAVVASRVEGTAVCSARARRARYSDPMLRHRQ
jgi:hypothetical protein